MIDWDTYERIIHSKEFKQWFGDWEHPTRSTSKIVDGDGKPLVVYHGSPYKFTEFKYGKNETSGQMGAEFAFWFSDNIKVAKDFSMCYPKSYYEEVKRIRSKFTKKSDEDKANYLKNLDGSIWEDLLKYFEDELGKNTGYYKMSSDVKNGNWLEISKTLYSLLSWFGRRNWDFLNTHKEFDEFFDLEKKYDEEEKREIDKVKDYYDKQPGYIYPCFIKATVIEEEEGESAGLGLGRLPDGNTHCKIIRFADTGSVLADEYIVTDPKRIKIATGENTTFNPKSKNLYEMITSFDVFEKKSDEICNNVLCFNKKLKKMGFISRDESYKVRVLIKGDGDELERTFDIEVPDISISRQDFETSKEYRDELEYYKNEVSVEGWNLNGEETEWREIFYHQIEDVLDDLNKNIF